MPLIAKTNGATTGQALELREGTLADLVAAERTSWRQVDESRPAGLDGYTQQFVRTGFPVAGDGTVSISWEVTAEPAVLVKMRLSQLAQQVALERIATGTLETSGQRIRIDDATFTVLKDGKDTIDAGVASTVAVVTATGQIVQAPIEAINAALVAIITARKAIFDALGTVMSAVAAGTVTTSAGVRQHAAWPA